MESLFRRGVQRWPGPPTLSILPEAARPPWGRVSSGDRGLHSASSALPRKVGPDSRPCPRAVCVLQEAVSETEGSGTRLSRRQGCGGGSPGKGSGRTEAACAGTREGCRVGPAGSGVKGACGEGGLVHLRGQKQAV